MSMTMHRLVDLSKKQVLCLLHNAQLDFFAETLQKGLDGKGLKNLQTHADIQKICQHCCRIHRNKLLRAVARWTRAGVQAKELHDHGKFFNAAVEPMLEVQDVINDLHARAIEVARTSRLLASPKARQQQMRRRSISFQPSDSDLSSEEEEESSKSIDHAPYRYSIQSQLGAGAFAQVSLATRTYLPLEDTEQGTQPAMDARRDIMDVDSDDDEGIEEKFALKRLSLPMSCLSEEEKMEAITEVHVLSTLVHPNILQYEDSFLDSGALHIVMEYAAGGTLEHVIDFYTNENLFIEEKMIWSILVQILQALNYCHAIPIMHRDIKPANVLLSSPITLLKNAQWVTTVMTAMTVRKAVSKLKATLRHHNWKSKIEKLQEQPKNVRFQTVSALTLTCQLVEAPEGEDAAEVAQSSAPERKQNDARQVGLCRVMLGDFGIAKVFDAQTKQTSQQCGTPHYISPELCEGKEYGMEADMWALGVVLYQLMTLRLPFDVKNANFVALFNLIVGDQKEIWEGTADKPSPSMIGYSSTLVDVCKRLLSRNAAERPSAAEVLKLPSFEMHIKQWEDVYQKTQWWNLSSGPKQKTSPKRKRQMILKQLNMLKRAASNLKSEAQLSEHNKRITSLLRDVEADRHLQSAQVYNAVGAVFAEMSDNSGAIHAYEEALSIAVRSIHKSPRHTRAALTLSPPSSTTSTPSGSPRHGGSRHRKSSSISAASPSAASSAAASPRFRHNKSASVGFVDQLEHDVVIDTDRLAQLPGRSTCVESLSELGTLLVKVAYKNYNLFKANKDIAPKKPAAARPPRIRRKISLVMDSKLIDDSMNKNSLYMESKQIRDLIAQQRRGLEYLEHANRIEETADRHAQIGSALKRQFIMSDCSDRSLLPRAVSAYRRSMDMNRADNAFGCYAMLNILTLEILLHERPVEDLLRDAEATYTEASALKLQKPGDIWVWVQEGDALVLRYLLDDPTVEIEAVDKSLRGTLTFGASKRIQQSIVDQFYFIRKTMRTLDKEHLTDALSRPGMLDIDESDEEKDEKTPGGDDVSAMVAQRMRKISQVIAIAESTRWEG